MMETEEPLFFTKSEFVLLLMGHKQRPHFNI